MRSNEKTVNLALQGGGAHGAFTWGVLDRLLEDTRVRIEGISATSSGAMNAVMIANGLATGGRVGAREKLAAFWEMIARRSPFDPTGSGMLAMFGAPQADPPPWMQAYIGLSRTLSPYVVNPLDINPLRDILSQIVEFDRLRDGCPIKLFVSATRVNSGKIRIFRNNELKVEVLLASACVPSLHHAVEIDGEAYWDGGFSGNPALFPLIFECRGEDIVIVMLHPLERSKVPTSAKAIWEHMTDLAFNSAFLREVQAIAHMKTHADRLWGFGPIERRFRRLKLHLIEGEALLGQLSHSSRFNARLSFLEHLRDQGREHASQWLEGQFSQVGSRSTLNIAEHFA
ncbi:MAG: patatin-like phospholipase family protein [Chromatiales bacterium]